MIIYIATSPSGKSYVGQTIQPLRKRINGHWESARNPKLNTAFCRAMRKYPNRHQWTWVVASRASSQKLLDAQEEFLIGFFGDYNSHPGGRGGPKTAEHRAKISESNRGQKRTPDQCARISASKTGRPWSAARVAAGHPLASDETKEKMSIARKGKPWSPARRAAYEASQ